MSSDTHLKCFILSGGEEHDAAAGRLLLETVGKQERTFPLLMERTYGDFKTRFTAWDLRFEAVVPPKRNNVHKWDYDKELYKRRNEIERFFRYRSLRIHRYTFMLCEHALGDSESSSPGHLANAKAKVSNAISNTKNLFFM